MEPLSLEALARRVGAEQGVPEAQALATLESALAHIRRELRSGNSVELPHLLTLSAVSEGALSKPKGPSASDVALTANVMVATPTPAPPPPPLPKSPSGRIIKPKRELKLPTPRVLNVVWDEFFQQEAENRERYRIFLGTPQASFFTDVILSRLTTPRSTAATLSGEKAILEAVSSVYPDLVILEAGFPPDARLVATIKERRETSRVCIIRIYGEDEDPQALQGLEVQAEGFLKEPYDLDDLIELCEKALARAAATRYENPHGLSCRLPTTPAALEEARSLVRRLLLASGLDQGASAELDLAFQEALANSAHHGNRDAAGKAIEIQYLATSEEVSFVLQDEGLGFDPKPYLQRELPQNGALSRLEGAGLGIALLRKNTDRLEYNEKGNGVRLAKKLRR